MMSSANAQQRRKPVHTIHSYELLELYEHDRDSDESKAIQSVLGDPVPSPDGLDASALPLLIVGDDQELIVRHLREQRANPTRALRPIGVVGIALARVDVDLELLADVIQPRRPKTHDLIEDGNTLELIANQIQRLPLAPHDPVMTLLQFMYTRGQALRPVVDAASRVAYRYPFAELLLNMNTLATQEILADLADHTLLASRHLDRVFTCPECGGYRVPVRELCPQCRSTNLRTQDSIHHFRCGYVAPETDFMRDGLAICPKCSDPLQHIGVEYNRPGRFVTCQNCDHWASEPDLTAWCADCNTYHDPGDLHTVLIHEFAITQNGLRVARAGAWEPDAAVRGARLPAASAGQAEDDDAEDNALLQMAKTLATQSDRAMALYEVILLVDDQADDGEAEELLADARRVLREVLRETDLVVDAGNYEFLLMLPDHASEPPPRPRAIEKHFRKTLGLRVRVNPILRGEGAPAMAKPEGQLYATHQDHY